MNISRAGFVAAQCRRVTAIDTDLHFVQLIRVWLRCEQRKVSTGVGIDGGRTHEAGRRSICGFALSDKRQRARPEIMLVTSRETRRWIIPKGWPQKGRTPYQSAAREAFEECGVIGTVGRRSIGSFVYRKQLKTGDTVDCTVRVFAMEVKRQHKAWPERDERTVKWLPVGVAATRVKERQLQAIIRRWALARSRRGLA
jgi:8-oxo-dGTP pyrophosphatase MutT (NUDIX family)